MRYFRKSMPSLKVCAHVAEHQLALDLAQGDREHAERLRALPLFQVALDGHSAMGWKDARGVHLNKRKAVA